MPQVLINGVNYYYERTGTGAETIVFSHGLLWSGFMFHKQVAFLKNRYEIITYDHRGQGKTEASSDGYDIETLYEDAVQLITKLTTNPVIFVGLSMGGFVGMRLAARRPDLVKKLILLETSCEAEPTENLTKYKTMNTVVKFLGFSLVVPSVMKIMFGRKFLKDKQRTAEKIFWIKQLTSNNSNSITKAVMGTISRKGIEEELVKITCPTLIIVGDQDVATPVEKAKKIHANIKDSKLEIIVGGGHTVTVEEPEACNQAIASFLKNA